MKVKNLKIFYKENKKSSPLIVFIHGAACDHTIWCYQNRYFFNIGFSTLTLDLPGHGKSGGKSKQSTRSKNAIRASDQSNQSKQAINQSDQS